MPIENLGSAISTPFTFSQSSLQDYADCPRRFQLRYIEALAWPAVESEPALENERRQQEGALFHRMAQQHLLGLPPDKLARLANTPNLSRWWDNFLAHRPDLPRSTLRGAQGRLLHAELSLSATIGDYRLLAKYDLVAVKPGGQAAIYDWKTYHKRPRNGWMAARLQTRVYRALLVQAGAHLNNGRAFQPEQIEMVYWYADYPSDPARFPYNAAQYTRDWDFLKKIVDEISTRQDFPMTEDDKDCRFCPYRSYCERGEKAGSKDEDEAGLEAASSEFNVNFEQVAEIEF